MNLMAFVISGYRFGSNILSLSSPHLNDRREPRAVWVAPYDVLDHIPALVNLCHYTVRIPAMIGGYDNLAPLVRRSALHTAIFQYVSMPVSPQSAYHYARLVAILMACDGRVNRYYYAP
jgi:hypothetical protein